MKTGRYLGEPLENRICKNCHNNKIEDEEHFLFYCDLYNDTREQFIIGLNNPDFVNFNFEEKMKFLNGKKPLIFSKFIHTIYDIRTKHNYN